MTSLTQKIIVSLQSESVGKLKSRIPARHLLIPSLPGLALKTHVESLASLAMSKSVLKALPDKLDIRRHLPSILYIYRHYGLLLQFYAIF